MNSNLDNINETSGSPAIGQVPDCIKSIATILLSDLEFRETSDLLFMTNKEDNMQRLTNALRTSSSFNLVFPSLQACGDALETALDYASDSPCTGNNGSIEQEDYDTPFRQGPSDLSLTHDDVNQILNLHKTLIQNFWLLSQNFVRTSLIALQTYQNALKLLELLPAGGSNISEVMKSVAFCGDWTANNLRRQAQESTSSIENLCSFAESIILSSSCLCRGDLMLKQHLRSNYHRVKLFWDTIASECKNITDHHVKQENIDEVLDLCKTNCMYKNNVKCNIVRSAALWAVVGRISLEACILEKRIIHQHSSVGHPTV